MGHDFEKIVQGTVVDEGGLMTWTKLPSDQGGETIGGVARKWNPGDLWTSMDYLKTVTGDFGRGVHGPIDLSEYARDHSSVTRVIREGVLAVYEEKGWLHKGLGSHVRDVGNFRVARKLFDVRYHSGTAMWGAVTRFVQTEIEATVDGVFGPGTLRALNTYMGDVSPDREEGMIEALDREWEIVTGIKDRMVEYYVVSGQRATKAEIRRLIEDPTTFTPEADDERVRDSYNATKQINMLGWVRRAASGV
jgi:hypothetical protein